MVVCKPEVYGILQLRRQRSFTGKSCLCKYSQCLESLFFEWPGEVMLSELISGWVTCNSNNNGSDISIRSY